MNLTLFFRLILMSTFSKTLFSLGKERFSYEKTWFYCPRVFAKDGWNISLQMHSGNYCSSENGYRKFGHTMETVEFGYPSEADEMLAEYAEDPTDLTNTVGSIPVSVLEEIFAKHGGIDWEQTISVENFNDSTSEE
jgi:hypothetical protein